MLTKAILNSKHFSCFQETLSSTQLRVRQEKWFFPRKVHEITSEMVPNKHPSTPQTCLIRRWHVCFETCARILIYITESENSKSLKFFPALGVDINQWSQWERSSTGWINKALQAIMICWLHSEIVMKKERHLASTRGSVVEKVLLLDFSCHT